MHPREALRRQITDEVRSCLPSSAYVSSSLARDVPSGSGLAVAVYTPRENISRVSANGEARTGQPIKRNITIAIVVLALDAGAGESAMSAADDASRLIEIRLASSFSNLIFESTSSAVMAGERTGAQIEMTYSVTHTDLMQGDPAA